MPEKNYDEEYIVNILAIQEDLNLKYGRLFADQSRCSKTVTERRKNDSENIIEHKANQSQTNRTFENKTHVNEIEQNKIKTSRQSEISTLRISKLNENKTSEKLDRENRYHWAATREIMGIIRKKITAPKQEVW